MTTAGTVKHLAIIAGGKGARLAEKLGDIPKALVPVGGKPLLQHQLEIAARSGVEQVTIFAGHLADQIVDFVGSGSRFGLVVQVVAEEQPSGTAGAVLRSLHMLPEHFFVLYGDLMLAVDLQSMGMRHLGRDADFTAFVHPNDHPHDSDVLEVDADDRVTSLHAYPHRAGEVHANLVNAALYVVRRDALLPLAGPGQIDFVKHVMSGLLTKGAHVLAYRSSEYIKDVGTPARLERVTADWYAGRIRTDASNSPRAAVFLDRDGTLNREIDGVRSPEQLDLVPGVASALKSLREAGFLLVVLTNQPVIARGEASEADVAAIHRRLEWELGKEGAYLDAIYVCPHHPDSGFAGERAELKIHCECRKPSSGLFERACRELSIEPAVSWMIGDQMRDVEAARRVGVRSILVRTGMAGRDGQFACNPDHVADDVSHAANVILQRVGGI